MTWHGGQGAKNFRMRECIQALLAQEPPLSFSEIGERVELSRQRVQQLAVEFGFAGRVKVRGRKRMKNRGKYRMGARTKENAV